MSRRTAWGTTSFAALVAVVILGPMLAVGFPLRFDLVSVPRPVLGDDALGLGDRLPRAIPLDGATAVLAKLLPDAWLTQLLALLALVLAGAGAAALASVPLPGKLVAAFAAQWNPFVLEQLAIGHTPHLLAYGSAPWAGLAGWWLTSRARPAGRSWAVLVLAVALGSLTPGGGALVALAALAGLLTGVQSRSYSLGPPHNGSQAALRGRPSEYGRGFRGVTSRLVAGIVTVVVLQLPWLTAAAMAPGLSGTAESSGAALTAFALNGETGWGRLIDALGLGGMWNQQALPASRGTVLAQVSTVLVIVLALGGVPRLLAVLRRRPETRPAAAGALAVSVLCYLIAVLPVLPGGVWVLSALVTAVPGAGLIRDGHRWLALPALGFAILAAHAVTGLGEWARARLRDSRRSMTTLWTASTAVLAGALLVAAMPDLAWGEGGRLQAWHYPAQWASVRSYLDEQHDTARILVLPFQPFRQFSWSGDSAVLDPAPRLLPRQTIVSDALPVDGHRLDPEGPGSTAITADIRNGPLTDDELGALSIGWILIEKGTPGELPTLPSGWSRVADGPDLELWRAPGVLPAAPRPSAARFTLVAGSQLVFGGFTLIALVTLGAGIADRAMRRTGSDATIGDRSRSPARE